ncbi:prepilin peptidase [Brevibacillus choshinensis]|uniref:Prepilin peptidase n=1 Tax=Brevibacillus choshinensis TaxID=54911 RepID=A0ABX7FVN5_BRECH|nr:A24 family peptidase [Brevibacillus choshinensis]QRG69396.1 prepilin peptidase [Brevibacillus choshinensis]
MAIAWILILLCVIVSWSDVGKRRIPNRALLAGLLVIAGSAIESWTMEEWMAHLSFGVAIILAFGCVAWLWPDHLGMGDAKLLGVLGFTLGLRPFVWVLTAACFLILLFSLWLLTLKRMNGKSSLPFAPFATLGLICYQISVWLSAS